MSHDHAGHGASPKADDVHNFMTDLFGSTAHGSSSATHDHSVHSHAEHGMKMWFHGGWNEIILFDFWRIDSLSGLVLSFVTIFIMGAMYEGIKWFRVYLQLNYHSEQAKKNELHLKEIHHDEIPLQCKIDHVSSNENVYNPTTTPPTPSARVHVRRSSPFASISPCSPGRILQASLYIIQLMLAYWLMLIVMTYNSWLTAAVILGAGFGHWLFAVLKFLNPVGETADSFATDACH